MTEAKYWKKLPDGRIACELCPQACVISEGKHGVCLGRANRDGVLKAENFGQCVSVAMDPIEKKPLFHVCPGSGALSFGMIGYGPHRYRYASGREGDFFITGFSPRKTALAVYIMPGFEPFEKHMARLGKYKTGRSCLYINKLEDVDEKVLEKLITDSVKLMRKRYKVKP